MDNAIPEVPEDDTCGRDQVTKNPENAFVWQFVCSV